MSCELKTFSRANVPCVLTSSRVNVSFMFTCSLAKASLVLACLRANVPCVLTCLQASVCCVLTYSRVNVSCVLTYSRANVSCVIDVVVSLLLTSNTFHNCSSVFSVSIVDLGGNSHQKKKPRHNAFLVRKKRLISCRGKLRTCDTSKTNLCVKIVYSLKSLHFKNYNEVLNLSRVFFQIYT